MVLFQRAVGNHVVARAIQRRSSVQLQPASSAVVQRDNTSDRVKNLEARTKMLEKKMSATQLDLRYRGLFGEKLSAYKQIVYRLTGGFQTAIGGFQGAQTKAAAQQAVIDQAFAMLVVTAGAVVLEPFLSRGLGALQAKLGTVSQSITKLDIAKTVEKIENPANAAAAGAGNVATTQRAGERGSGPQAPGVASGGGLGTGGGDPLSFLTSNLEALESHNKSFEASFSARAAQYETLTPEQWEAWDQAAEESRYQSHLKDLDSVALGDVNKLDGAPTIAVKIELYLWAAWIKSHSPGVKGLHITGPLAARLKSLGVESLAGVHFDTESWIFTNHQPENEWQDLLHKWAREWSQPLTK